MDKLRLLCLFSGFGAFEKALTNLSMDYELINFCEIDKHAAKSYCAIHDVNENLNLGDITKIDISKLPTNVDLITHGSPCQDYSISGLQAGGDKGSGTRSSLMWNTVEIVKHCKPKYVVWENVKNVLAKKHIHNFEQYLKDLEDIGYKSYYKVLNAKDFGIPQNRERIYCISILGEHKSYEFPDETLITTPNIRDYIEEFDSSSEYILKPYVRNQIRKTKFKKERYIQETEDIMNRTIKGFRIMDYRYDEGLRIRKNNLCPTLTTKANSSISSVPIVYNNGELRFMMPIESWRLMGFSDEDYHKAESIPTSIAQLYKQAGNSVVVKVVEKLYENLFDMGGISYE